jgi:hypothetical protein
MTNDTGAPTRDYHRNPLIGLRLPPERSAWLRRRAAETGTSASAIVDAALAEFETNHPTTKGAIP